jgi:Rhodopirellula transposase DDE domain
VEVTPEALARLFEVMTPLLDERQRRVLLGTTAEMLGRGGQARVTEASGASRSTVIAGMKELKAGVVGPSDRVRARGAGPKRLADTQPGLVEALDELVHPETRGNPMSLLRWTSKSVAKLTGELVRQGYRVSEDTVGRMLKALGYSLQSPAKVKEGAAHPDRDGQFRYLHGVAQSFVSGGEPVISVDTKKKEMVGEYDNGGREYQPEGQPERVLVHDFVDPVEGRAIPYGIFDETNNEGWVSVGDTADTAEFAVNSIRSWWINMGRGRFPAATRLLITADAGGSNGYRVRAWKYHLARLAVETGLEITVCHYPPGTSKWNRIEHRMFSFITTNWRGRPLISYRTIIELIAATTTKTGLRIRAELDTEWYPTGVKISDQQMAALPLTPHEWHGDWNYTLAATPND